MITTDVSKLEACFFSSLTGSTANTVTAKAEATIAIIVAFMIESL